MACSDGSDDGGVFGNDSGDIRHVVLVIWLNF